MRIDLHIKVELDVAEKKDVERIASEVSRAIRRMYGVRSAEVISTVEKE
jgi:hypothetical protein